MMPLEKNAINRTHDISCVDFHLKDLDKFGQCLEEAANAAFPKGSSRYKEIHVLLLSWEDDNLGVLTEVLELHDVFRHVYHYDVEDWGIPSDHSYKALRKQITEFLNEYEDKDSLLIVYYGGHGFMNDDRQCVWSCTGAPESPTVQWSGLQNLLEHAESDVLILLDCCAAASSISGTGSGVTEVIAACGFETWAPGVGEHSFTRSLIDELRYWSRGHLLSVAMLHNKVLSRIKYWKPRFGMNGEHEHRKTPIYIVLSNERRQRSIVLIPLQHSGHPSMESLDNRSQGSPSESSKSSFEAQSTTDENPSGSSQTSIDQVWPDNEFRHPKVLISLSLEEDQRLYKDAWVEWLRSVPASVKYTNVEGIYKSGSTMMMLSIPVAIWNLLPKNPAIAFIGFINSSNLIRSSASPSSASQERIKTEAKIPIYIETAPKSRLLREASDKMYIEDLPKSRLLRKASDKNDISLPTSDPSRSISETESDEACVTFTKTLDGYCRHGRTEYRKVGALFLTWMDDDLQCQNTEVDKLRQLFSKEFDFKTQYYEIPLQRASINLRKKLVDFCCEYDSPQDLAIIYYHGHPYEAESLKLGAKFEGGSCDDPCAEILTILRSFSSDQLVIFDCCHSTQGFIRENIQNPRSEILASAAHTVGSSSPNQAPSLTKTLNDVMMRLLKDNPKGFSSSHLYRELCRTVPFDSPSMPLRFDRAEHNLGSIWLRRQEGNTLSRSNEGGRYLKLTLELNNNPGVELMNELALQLQYLRHVKKVKIESLHAPRDQTTDFLRIALQAQKIRPLIRKIYAKRVLRRVIHSKYSSDIPLSLLKLQLKQIYLPAYDWSTAIRDHDTRGSEETRNRRKETIWPPSHRNVLDNIADHKRRRSSISDQQTPLNKRPSPRHR